MYASTEHGHTPEMILKKDSTVWFLTFFISLGLVFLQLVLQVTR